MDTARAKSLLQNQISQIDTLINSETTSPDFKTWRRDTQVVIERVFGEKTRHINDFNIIKYFVSSIYADRAKQRNAFAEGLRHAALLLESFIREVDEYGIESDAPNGESVTAMEAVSRICVRFHHVVRQLRQRYNERDTIDIGDEYDVQDLFYSLLHLYFDDIRPEEYTPSYAGKNSRVDFLIKQARVFVEIKMTRKGLTDKQVGEQLIVDIARYADHPDCGQLVCFVYNPEGRIRNVAGLISDIESKYDWVKVIITPE